MANIIEELTKDHREVEELFTEIDATTDPGRRRELADQMTAELIRHSVAEEEYLYPTVKKHVPGGEQLADKEIEEHAEVEKALKNLESLDGDDPAFMTTFRTVRDDVLQHVQEEENELFPQLAQHCGASDLDELGTKVDQAKKVSPTRPHPSAPDTPPLNKLLGPGAGLVDRLRDKLSGRSTEPGE